MLVLLLEKQKEKDEHASLIIRKTKEKDEHA